MRVAGDHTDVIAAEHLYQIEELFADQGLDRGRVIATFALRHAHKEHAQRDERFTRSGRCSQNDVIAGSQVHEGLFLVIPQLNAAIARPFKEAFEGLIGRKHGSGSLPSSGSHQVGESAPSEPNSASVPVPPENELAAPAPETVLAAVSVVVCAMCLLSLAIVRQLLWRSGGAGCQRARKCRKWAREVSALAAGASCLCGRGF